MTSRKLKPTAGPWAVDYKYFNRVVGQSGVVAECKRQTMHTSVQDNALLIAEAGTVHHECGLSPRELQERCSAMEAALQHCEQMLMKYAIDRVDHEAIEGEALEIIRAALAKHKEV